jgi:ABC-type transporter Mla subunit MlaD
MTEPSRYPGSKPDTTRRWVRVVVIIAIVVVLLVAVMLLIGGGGGHGPGRHI